MFQPGLHVVFDSSRDCQPPSDAEIDAVAVHGLNFKNNPDHGRETWGAGDKLWLKDFLPDYLPKPARVMLFAYNSSPAVGAASLKLDDHGRNLLQRLNLKWKASPLRPIIFICHSLGGLVVKSALVEATLDVSYKSIVEATRVLFFFATPHQGGHYASVGDVAATLVRSVLRTPENDLLEALKRQSDKTAGRFEQSRHLPEKCLVVSFFESLPFGKLGIIVDKKSATLNLPGTREKQVQIHRDHRNICKFDSLSNSECELALETILMETNRALEIEGPRADMHDPELSYMPPLTPRFIGRSEIINRVTNLCRSDGGQRRVVLSGLPGFGKTSIVLRYIQQNKDNSEAILWVNASSEATAVESLSEALRRIGDNSTSRASSQSALSRNLDAFFLVHRWLERQCTRWLMVIDSVNELDDWDIRRLLPSCSHGTVLITTTRRGLHKSLDTHCIEVPSLCVAESVEMLLKCAGIQSPSAENLQQVKSIVADLAGVPLAIEQAAAILVWGMPLDTFQRSYAKSYKKIMSQKPERSEWFYDKNQSIFNVFELLLEKFNDNPESYWLLTLVSIIGPGEVPFRPMQKANDLPSFGAVGISYIENDDLIASELLLPLCQWFEEIIKDDTGFKILAAAWTLESRSLLSVRKTMNMAAGFRTHEAIRRWCIERMEPRELEIWSFFAALVVSMFFLTDSKSECAQTPVFDRMVQNSVRNLRRIPDFGAKFRGNSLSTAYGFASRRLGLYLKGAAKFDDAKAMLVDAVACEIMAQGTAWPRDERSLRLQYALGEVHWVLGQLSTARDQFLALLEKSMSMLGDTADLTINVTNRLHVLQKKIRSHDAAAARVAWASYESTAILHESITSKRIIMFGRKDEPLTFLDASVNQKAYEAWQVSQAASPYSGIKVKHLPGDSRFHGRMEELNRIDYYLGQHVRREARATILVWGLAGVGKTALAIEFARKSRPKFDVILMLTLSTENQIKSDFNLIAHVHKLHVDKEPPNDFSTPKLVLDWLTHRNGAWLLILDNVTSPSFLQFMSYAPQVGNGSTLLLSRDPELRSHLRAIPTINLAPFYLEDNHF